MTGDTLTIGTRYDVDQLRLIGWTPAGSDTRGYDVWAYFGLEDDDYLGPDKHGVEPLFDPESVHKLGEEP